MRAAALLLVVWGPVAQGQAPPGPRALVRLDGIAAARPMVQLGTGFHVVTGTYTRLELVAAGGISRDDGGTCAVWRADAVTRFLLDPFGESRVGLYGLAGGSGMYDGTKWRPRLVLGLGLEGRRAGRAMWSGELALGGGVRAGAVLRRTRANRR